MGRIPLAAATAFALLLSIAAAGQDIGAPTAQQRTGAYIGKAYSPYATRSYPERPLWGDSHLHTSLSMDAGLFGNRLTISEACRFARGEEVVSSTGQPVRLSSPLDWLVVADHSNGMGLIHDLKVGKPELLEIEQAARWSSGPNEGGEYAREALKRGLEIEARLGANPYKFGMLGSTDGHTSLADAEEDNFFGKHAGTEPSPTPRRHLLVDTDQDLNSRMPAVVGYARGVPMGGDLRAAPKDATASTFMYGVKMSTDVPMTTQERA